MGKKKTKKLEEEYGFESGYFTNGVPYVKIGYGENIIVIIESLTYKHEPASGFVLKQFIKDSQIFIDDYTVYLMGRKPNLPKGYYMDKMAEDYAHVIKKELQKPVILMGTSTGGQIGQYLAADLPELVETLIIISAAYKISERGEEIERQSAVYFENGQYGKYLSIMMDLIFQPGIKRSIVKGFIRLIGRFLVGKVEYPNDYLVEVEADREMNFKDRLGEITVPTLILSGVQDICYDVEDVKITAKGIPNSKLILYDDYGHNLMVANKENVQKEILAFLNNH